MEFQTLLGVLAATEMISCSDWCVIHTMAGVT